MWLKFLTPKTFLQNEAGADGAAGGSSASGQANVTTTTTGEGGAAAPSGTPAPTTQLAFFPGATADDVGYIQAKGWDKSANPYEATLRSYQNLEKVFTADKANRAVIIPGENADPKTVNEFYGKLGRPEAADKYTKSQFAGMSDDLQKSLREKAFEIGLSDKQMAALSEWNDNAAKTRDAQLAEAGKAATAGQIEALRKEWGAAYDERVASAGRAAKELGWSKDQINTMQYALGFDGIMKMAYMLSQKVGEGQFISGTEGRGDANGPAMTPEQARHELNKLVTDSVFMKQWTDPMDPGHKDAVEKKTRLTKWSMGSK